MKSKTILLLFTVAATWLAACRTDGGDIGPLYGQWALKAMTIDGAQAPVDVDKYFWSFHGQLIGITTVTGPHSFILSNGTWERHGDDLTLRFTYSDTANPPGSTTYAPPAELGIPPAVSHLQIQKINASHMMLNYISDSGIVYSYSFKKLK